MKRILAIATLATLMGTATHAGDASCVGAIAIDADLAIITDGDRICQFQTQILLGKRILRVCPPGSDCTLNLSVDAMLAVPASTRPRRRSFSDVLGLDVGAGALLGVALSVALGKFPPTAGHI